MSGLALGWAEARLGDVATTQLGRMLAAHRETGTYARPYLRNRDVQWGTINTSALPVMDFDATDAQRFRLEPGDVLICEGGEVGRTAIWQGHIEECYYQKALHRVRTSPALAPLFLRYLMEHYASQRRFDPYTSGSTIAHLPQEDLRNLPLKLPPRMEQERIVAAIEEQFSRLDAGVVGIERVRGHLKRIRAAVLQAAIRGQLVRQQFEEECATSMLNARGIAVLPLNSALPDGWAEVRLGDLARTCSGGTPSRANKANFGGSIPWIKSGELREGLIQSTEERISYAGLSSSSSKVLPRGALLLALYGATVGRVAMLDLDGATTNQAICAILPHVTEVGPYLFYFLMASRDHLIGLGKGGAQPNISQTIVRELTIPMPPLEEQKRIVVATREWLTAISQLERDLSVQSSRATALRSSILAAAFSGKLVTQDPSDEPATTLLDRIADERASSNGHGYVRTRKPRRNLPA